MVRNYVTKKPYSTEKIKLNFACNKGNLLGGWVDSKTDLSDSGTQYNGYLFRKKNCIGEYDYYLGISEDKKLFRFFDLPPSNLESEYERLDYYQPKVTTIYGKSYKGKETFTTRKGELVKYIKDYVTANASAEFAETVLSGFDKDDASPKSLLNKIKSDPNLYESLLSSSEFKRYNKILMDEIKKTIASMKRLPNTAYILNKPYTLFTEIMDDIDMLAKNKVFNYFHVNQEEFEHALERDEKPLYMFKISNKDLSFAEKFARGERSSRGKDNLHTLYFKALMSGEQNVFDLGAAEVFYRKKSLPKKDPEHPAGQPIDAKNPKLNKKPCIFNYDLFKNRRYTVDKFQLHFSITANYQSAKKPQKINDKVCDYLRNNPYVNIIGIDRGERHLLYISMIDRNGNVVKDKNGRYIRIPSIQ